MTNITRDPWLLTPGPLTTSLSVKQAMLHDWGSRDPSFIAMNQRVRERLVALAGGDDTHVCVPIQGSGTFGVEAAIGTLLSSMAKALILVNGAYGARMAKICDYLGRQHIVHETPENVPNDVTALDQILSKDKDISHVFVVHCETTSGILNPITEIAECVATHRRRLVVDAMSSFGAIRLDAREVAFDALIASSNKCFEGVPGMGFVIVRRSVLEQCKGNAHSLSLDLYDQWVAMEANGQWRFTPPTHVMAALDRALDEHSDEGGIEGRCARYDQNLRILLDGMQELGFVPLLDQAIQAPVIVTFLMPADPRFDFQVFYDALSERGFLIYPGKLTVASSFRVGCIGRLAAPQIQAALAAMKDVLRGMSVSNCGPDANSSSETSAVN